MLAAALAAAGVALLACGEGDEPQTTAGGSAIALDVTLDADGPGSEKPRTRSIACESGSGCADGAEELSAEAFAPVPADTACTEIFGGPDTATVEGTLDGERVAADLTRANGCEIDRFDRFAGLLTALFPGYRPGAALRP